MATSRVHTPPRLRSTPDLIPAAGTWKRGYEHTKECVFGARMERLGLRQAALPARAQLAQSP
jgi:hypothetical protein